MSAARDRAVALDCLRRFRVPAGVYLLQVLGCYAVFRLYGLDTEPFWYVFALGFCFLLGCFLVSLQRARRRAALRWDALQTVRTAWRQLPAPETLAEADWCAMLSGLGAELEKLAADSAAQQREAQDFYTAWVHQIKTPIAVMKLALGAGETPDPAALREELFRIEQYTDMALVYQRLGSRSNDLVIEEYALDTLIRETVRKFAGPFIHKKLRLDYPGTEARIVTDRKWFLCILEQLVSNALKYTPAGTITVSVRDGVLTVADTGVGIVPEDLPRIFEQGYTGVNGHRSGSSSGLGLYLCGKASALLNIPVTVDSAPGRGSRFSLDLRDKLVSP
ncbi:MAG: HAMP domain-containing histidine kinase [Oscillospiraceae bacterium]|nr:HAMP domain-containing histidine kinase [Oscillospiraceae bacterium]